MNKRPEALQVEDLVYSCVGATVWSEVRMTVFVCLFQRVV